METAPDDAHWAAYNADQGDRPARPLCREVLELAGVGSGRTAVDLGCGAGRETIALLDAGWRVHAIDGILPAFADVDRERLTVEAAHFAELTVLPTADLVYAGYSLPYQPPDQFHRLWKLIRASLQPGGWIAANIFGERDAWAGAAGMTFLRSAEVRGLFDGMEIVRWSETDEEGPAYSGPKHWHVFDVVARLPA